MRTSSLFIKQIACIIASALFLTACNSPVQFKSEKLAKASDVIVPCNDGTYVDPDLPTPPPCEPPPVVVDPPPPVVVDPPPVVVDPPPVVVDPPPVVVDPPPPVVVDPPPPVVVDPPPPVVVDPPPPVVVDPPPPVVVDPPPVVEPPSDDPLREIAGTCPQGRDGSGKITSCLSCPVQDPDADLSGKAKRLLDTMERACQIPNKSAPANYVPPTRAELKRRLRACSPEIYPDTVLTKEEQAVIPRLTYGDSWLLDRMFGGLWYQPPYSDAFDHYFGLGVNEAVPLFCFRTMPALVGELWSREMWDWWMIDFVFNWPRDLQALHAYYQKVRSGLVKCLDKEGTGGPGGSLPSAPSTSQPSCDYKVYTGIDIVQFRTRAAELIGAGYVVTLESPVACLRVDPNITLNSQGEELTLGGYKCH